ncbi:SRPBCC family protein [Sphingomonas sp. SRS2]|uniref:SRPBCC family protein n=1 Tax=Sphingomonas sp. SRS2 TaxID=133190 RepID=UPI0006184022|nr:SRPBCC family protein [Sphingomonas sp. SRS2]KKC24489.1 vanillate O-demethylase oxidoreductase VanB [Sphingomonas sp. SRS2]
MPNSIEREIQLSASVERVWRALTDHREFGEWFRVRLDGPFAVGEMSSGHITHEGFEHVRWNARTVAMEEPYRFAFTWHPYAVDPAIDYSAEEPTLVEFRLESRDGGTHLTITESGFDRVPAYRRDEALRMNGGGWTAQIANIRIHVDG